MELCRTIFGSAAHAEPFYSSGTSWKNLKGSVQLCRTKKVLPNNTELWKVLPQKYRTQ
jgi:hypothetical protein